MDDFVFWMEQAIEPVGESRDDYDIFSDLAIRLGAADRFSEGRTSEEWLEHLYETFRSFHPQYPTLSELQDVGHFQIPEELTPPVPSSLVSFRTAPTVNPLKTPSGKIELYSEDIERFGYEDCPPHPTWLEPFEWLGNADTYPLHLISNQPRTRLHSQFDPGRVSKASKIKGREPMVMHPADAAARGIADGDVVRVFNGRGACLAGVILSDTVMRGVVQLSTGAWYDPEEPGVEGSLCKHGNPNVLTRDVGTSRIGQGPSAQTVLVEVARFEGTPPPVTAFVPPVIEERE